MRRRRFLALRLYRFVFQQFRQIKVLFDQPVDLPSLFDHHLVEFVDRFLLNGNGAFDLDQAFFQNLLFHN